MALRKPRPEDMAPPGGGTATALAEPPPAQGESIDECNAVGQALIAGGHLSQESFDTVSAATGGDLLKFVTLLLSHHGVGRNDLARGQPRRSGARRAARRKIVGQALRDRALTSTSSRSTTPPHPVPHRRRPGRGVQSAARRTTPLVSRLKIMSGMNIVERRRPQDGQFSTKVDGRELDVRVASVATRCSARRSCMRLLDKSKSMKGLGRARHAAETYNTFSKMVHAPFGMVICAGPTGAGKTTTCTPRCSRSTRPART
jgi:hypothetical protein